MKAYNQCKQLSEALETISLIQIPPLLLQRLTSVDCVLTDKVTVSRCKSDTTIVVSVLNDQSFCYYKGVFEEAFLALYFAKVDLKTRAF